MNVGDGGLDQMYSPHGKHIIMEYWNVDPKILDDEPYLTKLLCEAVKKSGTHILNVQSHKFDLGCNATLLLSESHAAYHTYPKVVLVNENSKEYITSYMSACIYTCGESIDPTVSFEVMKEALNPGKCYFKIIGRGFENGLIMN